jgi:uncharacterized protein (TIGR00297 family)
MQLVTGVLLAVSISYLAYLSHNLSGSGSLAACVLGTLVFGLGGWPWAAILLTFFVASSVLSRAFSKARAQASEKYAKGSRRDAGQVLGNGGAAAFFVVMHALFPGSALPWLGFAASVAAVNADTWATELGVLARTPPRLITHLARRVERGTSGGVSILGSLAAVLGAAAIGGLASLLGTPPRAQVFWAVFAGGILGAFLDSFLGATVQAIYRCDRDGKDT